MSCGVGHRHGSDLVLLWLWCSSGYSCDSTPSLGTSICRGYGPKKTKKKKKKKKDPIGLMAKEIPRALGAVSQELWTKTKYIRNIFWSSEWPNAYFLWITALNMLYEWLLGVELRSTSPGSLQPHIAGPSAWGQPRAISSERWSHCRGWERKQVGSHFSKGGRKVG